MTQDIDIGKLSEQINDKANKDLWNTVPNVWDNTLNTSQITNCITEIPQDIKLELKDGVLTLKAGSKVYVPNGFETNDKVYYAWTNSAGSSYWSESIAPNKGDFLYDKNLTITPSQVYSYTASTDSINIELAYPADFSRDSSKDKTVTTPDTTKPKFDVATIENDVTHTNSSGYVGEAMLSYSPSGFCMTTGTPLHCSSGSNWTATYQYNCRYNTSENRIKWTDDTGSTWSNYIISLPIAKVYIDGTNGITEIRQIFSGFGYIGSTVFALPGVKVRISNGRNTDGSLKNVEFTTGKVLINTLPDNVSRPHKMFLYPSNIYNWGSDNGNVQYYRSRPAQAPITYCTAYIEDENKWIRSLASTTWEVELTEVDVVDLNLNNSVITSFTPKTTFHALDYNDKPVISGWGMPSTRYIDLTLGASGATYSAPANGWFYANKASSGASQFIMFQYANSHTVLSDVCWSTASGQAVTSLLPVLKGQSVVLNYNAGGSWSFLKFVYAEGEN